MEIEIPQKVNNNFQGYVLFSRINALTKQCYEDEIVLNFSLTRVFESNLFSILASLVAIWERKRNKVRFVGMQASIQNLFNTKKLVNGSARKFLWKSLIKCQHFASPNEEILSEYLETKIFPERSDIVLNQHLKMAIQLCVAEVFRNAFTHSNCKEVFIAHFFSVYNRKLFVTVVSQGKTMRQLAAETNKKQQSGVEGIEWAVKNGSTSKKEHHKGIGLYTIRQFIQQNQGKIQIVSGDGVWKQVKSRTFSKQFEKEFPGSVVTLEFNLQE